MLPISVVIPVYNAEEFLKETIESVLNQTFSDFELILADDMSTDRSRDIVFSFDDKRIRYVLCTHDFVGTHRKGYRLAKGKYIAHLDHDDLMMPQRLQIQFDFMESHPDIDVCGGYMFSFGNQTRLMMNQFSTHDDMAILMILGMSSYNSSGFFRREFLVRNKIVHKRGYSYAADFKFWSDIAKVGKMANIPEVMTRYRKSDKQASVVHQRELREGAFLVQNEMVEFFLSKLDANSEAGKLIFKKLLPSVEKMVQLGFFSLDGYFAFMYELIRGLKWKNELRN